VEQESSSEVNLAVDGTKMAKAIEGSSNQSIHRDDCRLYSDVVPDLCCILVGPDEVAA
jgi:hypothetical protein